MQIVIVLLRTREEDRRGVYNEGYKQTSNVLGPVFEFEASFMKSSSG